MQTHKSLEGATETVNLSRESAGTFNYLCKTTEIMDSKFTPDLSRESCEFMAMFMIAQAQAIFVKIATKKKMSAGLVAKRAQGGAFLFEKALRALQSSKIFVTWMRNSGCCKLIEHSKCQQSFSMAKAQICQAKINAKEDEYGQESGRLRLALKWVKVANRRSLVQDGSRTVLKELVRRRTTTKSTFISVKSGRFACNSRESCLQRKRILTGGYTATRKSNKRLGTSNCDEGK